MCTVRLCHYAYVNLDSETVLLAIAKTSKHFPCGSGFVMVLGTSM